MGYKEYLESVDKLKKREEEKRHQFFAQHPELAGQGRNLWEETEESETKIIYQDTEWTPRQWDAEQYRQDHKAEIAEYYQVHKARKAETDKQYRQAHRLESAKYSRQYRQTHSQQIRIEILTHYGNGKLACVRCGLDDIRALSIDHINGKGAEHRQIEGTGFGFYRWLVRNNLPEGYQTLCMSCQFIKCAEEGERIGKNRPESKQQILLKPERVEIQRLLL